MNLSGLQFWTKASHDVLVLLNAGHAGKYSAFHEHFPVILSSGQIENLDRGIRIMLL